MALPAPWSISPKLEANTKPVCEGYQETPICRINTHKKEANTTNCTLITDTALLTLNCKDDR